MVVKKDLSKIIFFDFDGTICDTSGFFHEALMKFFDKLDFKVSKSLLKKQMGKKTGDIFRSIGLGGSNVSSLVKSFYNDLMGGVSRDRISLCVNISPLRDLKKKGYRFIIITNNDREFVKRALKALRISNLFSEVYGDQDFKTKDEILKKLIKKYNLIGYKTIFVGDRFSDISMAHRAHLIAVAIHNDCSVSSKKEILLEKPDYIISSFDELKRIILSKKPN